MGPSFLVCLPEVLGVSKFPTKQVVLACNPSTQEMAPEGEQSGLSSEKDHLVFVLRWKKEREREIDGWI